MSPGLVGAFSSAVVPTAQTSSEARAVTEASDSGNAPACGRRTWLHDEPSQCIASGFVIPEGRVAPRLEDRPHRPHVVSRDGRDRGEGGRPVRVEREEHPMPADAVPSEHQPVAAGGTDGPGTVRSGLDDAAQVSAVGESRAGSGAAIPTRSNGRSSPDRDRSWSRPPRRRRSRPRRRPSGSDTGWEGGDRLTRPRRPVPPPRVGAPLGGGAPEADDPRVRRGDGVDRERHR